MRPYSPKDLRLPALQVATASTTAMFFEFDETALDFVFHSVWNKAKDIYPNRTRCLLFRESSGPESEYVIKCVAISMDKGRRGTYNEVSVDGRTGKCACTCDFFLYEQPWSM